MHSLFKINEEDRTANCIECGKGVKIRRKGYRANGSIIWRCSKADNARENLRKHPYRKHKKDRCERCGFIPEDSCQLDVDHVDGNKANNEPSNLQTLCANCHRLKTKNNSDWRS